MGWDRSGWDGLGWEWDGLRIGIGIGGIDDNMVGAVDTGEGPDSSGGLRAIGSKLTMVVVILLAYLLHSSGS